MFHLKLVVLKNTDFCLFGIAIGLIGSEYLSSETVKGAALSLKGIDYIKSSDGLSASVLSVGHGVLDNGLQEDLEDTASLLVDETADALHTTATSQTADSGLGDALNVVTKNLAVSLGTTLSESLTTFTTARHS